MVTRQAQQPSSTESGATAGEPSAPVGVRPPARRLVGAAGVLQVIERVGLILVFGVMVLFFALGSSGSVFLESANIKNILAGQAVVGVIAVAMIPPLVCGYFDLSVAATAGIANVAVAAAISKYGASIEVAIAVGIVFGTLIGIFNGFLVAALKLNAFIVTFGVYTALSGVIIWYTKGEQIVANIPQSVGAWSGKDWLGVPRPFVTMMVIAAVVWFLLTHFPWGGISKRLDRVRRRRGLWAFVWRGQCGWRSCSVAPWLGLRAR